MRGIFDENCGAINHEPQCHLWGHKHSVQAVQTVQDGQLENGAQSPHKSDIRMIWSKLMVPRTFWAELMALWKTSKKIMIFFSIRTIPTLYTLHCTLYTAHFTVHITVHTVYITVHSNVQRWNKQMLLSTPYNLQNVEALLPTWSGIRKEYFYTYFKSPLILIYIFLTTQWT